MNLPVNLDLLKLKPKKLDLKFGRNSISWNLTEIAQPSSDIIDIIISIPVSLCGLPASREIKICNAFAKSKGKSRAALTGTVRAGAILS